MEEGEVILTDDRRGNWFWDYNDVLDSDLSEHAKIVRLCLARFANQNERKAWPSLSKIAEKASISVATVKRALSELEAKGWIQRKSRKLPDEGYATTVYILQDPPSLNERKTSSLDEEAWLRQSQPLAQTEPTLGSHRANLSSHRANPWLTQSQPLAHTEPTLGSDRATNNNNRTIPNRTIPIENLSLSSSIEEERDVNPANNIESQPPTQQPIKLSNKDLIAELTGKLHELPIQKLKGHFSLIGKAYNRYGYQAVLAAIEDLSIEFLAAEQLGDPLVLSEKELARRLFARCRWNSVSVEKALTQPEGRGGEKKEERPEWQRNWKKVAGHWTYVPEELDPNEWEIDRENKVIRRKKKEKEIICRKGKVVVDAGD
ncbi:MAG: helix-turn-helix domain-containing protein [Candidatus Hadarchaeum sp.]